MESRMRARMNPTGIKKLSSIALHPRGGCGPFSARIFALYVQASLISLRWFIVVSGVARPGIQAHVYRSGRSRYPARQCFFAYVCLIRRHLVVTELCSISSRSERRTPAASGEHRAMSCSERDCRQPPAMRRLNRTRVVHTSSFVFANG